MSSIRVEGLGKAYKQYPTRWSRLAEWVLPFRGMTHSLHWVLQDISFEIEPGEAIGILGINGAGKSTLLKIISGTTQPTTGIVHTSGHLAALLELGMGFHPDFTGRQNVFMAAQLLGMSIEEVADLMPTIEGFSEIGEYIDQPVRVFSSGMHVRLAFSVATAKRPDILIVDEALAVGDAAFQRKCFQRIEAYLSAGTTLLFVSHDTETVKKLCTRALFIKDGRLEEFGTSKHVCDQYEKYLFGGDDYEQFRYVSKDAAANQQVSKYDPSLTTSCEVSYGNGKADIMSVWIEDIEGSRINIVESGEKFCWCYRVRFNQNVDCPIFAMMLKTREGVALYGVDSKGLIIEGGCYKAGDVIDVRFTLTNVLAQGIYYLNCGIRLKNETGVEFLSRRIDSAILRVIPGSGSTAATGLLEMGANLDLCRTDLIASSLR